MANTAPREVPCLSNDNMVWVVFLKKERHEGSLKVSGTRVHQLPNVNLLLYEVRGCGSHDFEGSLPSPKSFLLIVTENHETRIKQQKVNLLGRVLVLTKHGAVNFQMASWVIQDILLVA